MCSLHAIATVSRGRHEGAVTLQAYGAGCAGAVTRSNPWRRDALGATEIVYVFRAQPRHTSSEHREVLFGITLEICGSQILEKRAVQSGLRTTPQQRCRVLQCMHARDLIKTIDREKGIMPDPSGQCQCFHVDCWMWYLEIRSTKEHFKFSITHLPEK